MKTGDKTRLPTREPWGRPAKDPRHLVQECQGLHQPRRLEGASQSWCPQTRVWLLINRWGHVVASSTEGWPGLPVIDMPRERSYREY